MAFTEQELADIAQLSKFLQHVRQVWMLRRTPEARKEIERGFEDMCAGQMSEVIWRVKYEGLAERFDRAVSHAAAEAEADRRTLRRVRQYLTANRTRKTVSREDLAVILSKCDICGIRDAAYLQYGRPVCTEDYVHVTV
jgi:hypothetical protein